MLRLQGTIGEGRSLCIARQTKAVYLPPPPRRKSMRMLMKVSMPTESGNAAVRNGSLQKTIKAILDDLKPEAAYFVAENGKRTGYVFFNMKESSQIPGIAEPWFLALNADITFCPVMNPQDLAAASPDMEKAAKTWAMAA